MKINYQRLFISILTPIILGSLVGLLTSAGSNIPSILPDWVFVLVWTILYFLMGVSAYLVYEKEEELPRIYVTQLIFNLLWSFIFFTFKWFTLAFIWIIILFILVLRMIREFRSISKLAGNLQIPYLLWLVVAAFLNLMYIIR